jgi:anaerobic nitric oxide reductase flavorubredoxin
MKKHIKNNVYWVGSNDHDLRKFHGNELSTFKGSTYNSYLILEEKIALIDTVWGPFARKFVENLEKEIDLNKIDYIIANHGETDHSGALPLLMERYPNKPIYCSEAGIKSIKGQYHKDWDFIPVKTNDKISLGKKDLIFISAPMLHWPDSMFCYLTEDNILFSNDAFGQHYCSESLFNDSVDQEELFHEALKYYANILTPFSAIASKKIAEYVSLQLPTEMICPSHGMIWRSNPMQIVDKYIKWSNNYQENQVTILYDTMWNGTRTLAENIARGILSVDNTLSIKLLNTSVTDKNDIITEIFKSKAILVGSPTINKGILSSVAGILEMIHGLYFKNKKAASFGCYGWYCASVELINKHLKDANFTLVNEGFKANWSPDEKVISQSFDFGCEFAKSL